jgi:hypothetical protein
MFRTAPVPEPEPAEVENVLHRGANDDLIPLSHVGLEIGEPAEGWAVFLGARGIRFVADRIGRDSVSVGDAQRLLAERREAELKKRARLKAQEAAAVEADELRRASIWKGVSADMLPPGEHPVSVMLAAAKEQEPKRVSPLQEALSNSGTLTYHELPRGDE